MHFLTLNLRRKTQNGKKELNLHKSHDLFSAFSINKKYHHCLCVCFQREILNCFLSDETKREKPQVWLLLFTKTTLLRGQKVVGGSHLETIQQSCLI